jgi:hypothetical protein
VSFIYNTRQTLKKPLRCQGVRRVKLNKQNLLKRIDEKWLNYEWFDEHD